MGGSGRPKGGKVPLRCGRCHRVFDDMKAIILHAQQEHRVSQMPYPCPHCGIVGYYREKLLKRHLRIRCLGRGGEDRLEASGDTGSKLGTNSPQDECPRGTPVQSERQSSKTISSFGPLSNEKVRRNSPKSAPASEDQTPHLHRLRRSSLRSAQLEILTNDQPGVPEDLSPKPFSKEENFADPPSEVSSSHESLPISVRMSTRMRTMSSSEQKRTKEAENCNLVSPGQLSTRMLKGGVKHSPKAGRKNTSNNVISSRNRSSATPVEMKKKSLSHKIPNLDSLRNLKKSRLIAIKTCGPAICPSGNACASVELTTGPRFSSPMNSPQKTGKLHASSVKSGKSTVASKQSRRLHSSSVDHGSLNISPDPKESQLGADMRNKPAKEKKCSHAKLKMSNLVVHRRMNQNRACKKAVSKALSVDKNSPLGSAVLEANCTESVSNQLAGSVSQSRAGDQLTDRSDTLHKMEREILTAAASSPESLIRPTKRSSRKLVGDLSDIDFEERNEGTKSGDNPIALKNQTSLKSLIDVDGEKELGASSPQTTVMLTLRQKESSKAPVGVSRPLLPVLLNASVKLEVITNKSKINLSSLKKPSENVKSIELKPDDLAKGCALTTEGKSITAARTPNNDVGLLTAVQNRCGVAETAKPESSGESMDNGSEFRSLGDDEMPRVPKRSTYVKPTGSTANDSCVTSTQCMRVPTAGKPNSVSRIASTKSSSKSSISGLKDSSSKSVNSTPTATPTAAAAVTTPTLVTASTRTVPTTIVTSPPSGKVALVDWDCFIAKDRRKARCSSVAVATASTTPPHHSTKSPPRSRLSPSVNLAVVAYPGPDTFTSQLVERRPRHLKKVPAAEDSTLSSSAKQATDAVNSDGCRLRQPRSCNSPMSGSMQLLAEGSNIGHDTFATPSKCDEELSSKRVSASSLDSSLPVNDDGGVFGSSASDINVFGHPSSMSNNACGKGNHTATENVVQPLSSHDTSDSNSEATAPAVNNSHDLLILSSSNCQVEEDQAFRKRLRPRKSIDYFRLAKRPSKRMKIEEVENEVISKSESTRQKEACKDEDDDEVVSQGNNESKGKHMTTHCCPVCRLSGFATLAELKVHRTISCRRKFKKSKRLKERSIEWYCPGCPTTQGPFESAAALLTHLLTCRTKKPCGGKVKANHPALSAAPLCPSTLLGPSTTFGCSVCGVIVASESRLEKHRRDEHNY